MPDIEGKEAWSTMRDLQLVWADEKCKKDGYGPKNTIIIDSEAFKVRKHPLNSIVIKPYSKEDLLNNAGNNMEIMDSCNKYIQKMLNQTEDVQEFLANEPFEFDDTKN